MSYTPVFTSNPGDADLAAYLTAAGFYSAQIANLNVGFVAASIKRFERATGRIPFLAGSPGTSYLFDPPGGNSKQWQGALVGGEKIMELQTYFTAITNINIGYSAVDNPTGTPLDLTRQVYFRPDNNASVLEAIEWLEFLFPIWGLKQSIQIIGTPGSVTAWPEDAWYAVLAGAAAELSPIVGASLSGGNLMAKEDDSSESFAPNPMAAFEDAWRKQFKTAVMGYKTNRIGL